MTQEQKELLLKDICTRVNYKVMCSIYRIDDCDVGWRDEILTGYFNNGIFYEFYLGKTPISIDDISKIKPYLRPMSSMTEEEGKELERLFSEIDAPCWVDTTYGCVTFAGDNDFIDTEIAEIYTDWLNAHHFDYRGLIEKGLALEAKEGMYNIK